MRNLPYFALDCASDGIVIVAHGRIAYANSVFKNSFFFVNKEDELYDNLYFHGSQKSFRAMGEDCLETQKPRRIIEDINEHRVEITTRPYDDSTFVATFKILQRGPHRLNNKPDPQRWSNLFKNVGASCTPYFIAVEYHADIHDLKMLACSEGSVQAMSETTEGECDSFFKSEHRSESDSVNKLLAGQLGFNEEYIATVCKACDKLSGDRMNLETILLQKSSHGDTVSMITAVRFLDFSEDDKPIFFICSQDITRSSYLEKKVVFLKNFIDKAPFFMGIIQRTKNEEDLEGFTFKYANEHLQRFHGFDPSRDELEGKTCMEVPDASYVRDFLETARRGEDHTTSSIEETQLSNNRGENLWINYYFHHLGDGLHAFLANDLTHIKELEEKLKENQKKLEEAVELRTRQLQDALEVKSKFLATMSHEIRTPVTGIKGALNYLEQLELNDDWKEMLHISNVCCEHLLSIINDILDFSKIEADKVELEFEEFDIHGTLEESLEVVSFSAQKKKLQLISDIEKSVPLRVIGDVTSFRQILVNLLSNAVKFSSSGEIILRARCVTSNKSQTTLEISVQDQGIGIGESAKNSLFQPFTQADASVTRKFGGSGLGLSITKRLVELMGGNIWFSSNENKGSTFFFTVTMGTVTDNSISVPKGISSGKVIVLEPCINQSNSIKNKLSNLEFSSETFSSISDLQENFLEISSYDRIIILADSQYESAQIKKIYPTAVVIVMGYQISHAGDFFLSKPMKSKSLYEVLYQIITGNPVEIVQSPKYCLLRQSDVKILVAEDNTMNQVVIKKLLQSMGYPCIDIVNNGKEAVEAVKNKDYTIVLMDIMMPEMSGKDATIVIRREVEQSRQPVIIALTADVFTENQTKYKACGMNDVVNKPIDRNELCRIIKKYSS